MGDKKIHSCCDGKKSFKDCKVTINCCHDKNENIHPSAFIANNDTATQNVTAGIPVFPVLYPTKILDLNNEYDPATATFTPKQGGVYSIIASVNFIPPVVNGSIIPTKYRVLIIIMVNGIQAVVDNDFFGRISIGDVTSVSGILQLAAGDKVNVSMVSSTDGTLLPTAVAAHFEAARFPSPPINNSSKYSKPSDPNVFSSGNI